MKTGFFIILMFSVTVCSAQGRNWQQRADYIINVSLNDVKHTLKGDATINYTNNSPDTLGFVWLHLWPNAFKNDETAFAKQVLRDNGGKKRLKGMKERGSMDSLNFFANGIPARTEQHPEYIDVVKIVLPSPLMPGASAKITTPFHVNIPTYISRSGHEEQNYIICQWYPKVAVYDRKGWHPTPYLDHGEFYNEFGNYQVNITLPASYVVGATGNLENEDESALYKKIGNANVAGGNEKYPSRQGNKTLRFRADTVPDFAWFANKDFLIRHEVAVVGGKPIDVFAYHHPKGNPRWKNATGYIITALTSYSRWLGNYTFPVAAAVEGPHNDMSGGMEYPMITLITMPKADEELLDAVITHEVGHNWFPMMVASNERDHAWMDEGINSYYQFRYEAEKFKGNSIFGNAIPSDLKAKPVKEFQTDIYAAMTKLPMDDVIDKPSTAFRNKQDYGLITYVKTALWMYLMETAFGQSALDAAMQAYFKEWKFRHPYPEDLKASLEKHLNKDLTLFFNLLQKQGDITN